MTDPNIFIARQPILDRDGNIWAYELLFRDGKTNRANINCNLMATARVIANTVNYFEISNILGDNIGLINVDETILQQDFIELLPAKKFILEILETTEVTDSLVSRVKELCALGYRFTIDDFDFSPEYIRAFKPLYDLVEIIKVDLMTLNEQREDLMEKFLPVLKKKKLKFLAEKVETEEEFKICKELGFEFFQGYFFFKPEILESTDIEPSRSAVIEIMELLRRDAGLDSIDAAFQHHPDLSVNLLKYLNSAHLGIRETIRSIRHAISLLGKIPLMRWVSIFMYAELKEKAFAQALLESALLRARIMSWIAHEKKDRILEEEAYLTGMLSLSEALFGRRLESILGTVSISKNIKDALLYRKNELGQMLILVESLEQERTHDVKNIASKIGIKSKDVYAKRFDILKDITKQLAP